MHMIKCLLAKSLRSLASSMDMSAEDDVPLAVKIRSKAEAAAEGEDYDPEDDEEAGPPLPGKEARARRAALAAAVAEGRKRRAFDPLLRAAVRSFAVQRTL